MIAKRTPSAPPIDLVLSMLYVAPCRLPGDDVSGSSVSRPSKPGQVGHCYLFLKHRVRIHDPVATLDLQRTETRLIAQLQSVWQLAELAMTNIVPLTMPGGCRGIGLEV